MRIEKYFIYIVPFYLVLTISLTWGDPVSFFVCIMPLGWLIFWHWLFLFEGTWSQKGQRDNNIGSLVVVLVHLLIVVPLLTSGIFELNASYWDKDVITAIGLGIAILCMLVIAIMDKLFLRNMGSITRKSIFYAILLLIYVLIMSIAGPLNWNEYGKHSKWFLGPALNSIEHGVHISIFVLQGVGLIFPFFYILWKKAELAMEEEQAQSDPFLDAEDRKEIQLEARKNLPLQDRIAMQQKKKMPPSR